MKAAGLEMPDVS